MFVIVYLAYFPTDQHSFSTVRWPHPALCNALSWSRIALTIFGLVSKNLKSHYRWYHVHFRVVMCGFPQYGRPQRGPCGAKLWYWFPLPIFTCESSYCFQRVLAIAILSVCLFVRLSVTRVDQSKKVQDCITKSSPSTAGKTLVSGTVKLFHKFEGGHPERGC